MRPAHASKLCLAALASFSFGASHAFAVGDAAVLAGSRSASFKYDVGNDERSKTVKSTEIGVGAHFHPMKTLPVGIGFFASMNDFDLTEIARDQYAPLTEAEFNGVTYDEPTSHLKGLTYGPEVTVWLPVPMLSPYVRVGYPLGTYESSTKLSYSAATFDGETSQVITYDVSGLDMGIGVAYSPLPLVGILLEYQVGEQKLEAKKAVVKTDVSFGGNTQSDEEDFDVADLSDADRKRDLGSAAIRLGIQVSL